MRRRTLIRHLATAVTALYSSSSSASFIRTSPPHCDHIDSSLSSIEQRVFDTSIRRQSPHLLVIGALLAAYYYSDSFDLIDNESSIGAQAIIAVVDSADFNIRINNNTTYLRAINCSIDDDEKEQRRSTLAVVAFTIPNRSDQLLLIYLRSLHLNVCLVEAAVDCDLAITECQPIVDNSDLSIDAYRCCCRRDLSSMNNNCTTGSHNISTMCTSAVVTDQLDPRIRTLLLVINAISAVTSLLLVSLVVRQRNTQQYGARGWALMELFLVGAALLYSILLLDWIRPSGIWTCCANVWLRELGFATFYGSVVLKIYRNLQEYRVRKAHHVYVKEADLLKYLVYLIALTATGLLAWTLGTLQTDTGVSSLVHNASTTPICSLQYWSIAWQLYELCFLSYGIRLCYKARNSSWLERWQFTVAVCLEASVTLIANALRFTMRDTGHPDTFMLVTFVQLHLTVTVNIVIIMAPKFYFVTIESTRRTLTLSGSSARAHPSLARLRDNLVNGTIDFAEVPIAEMNPEDIRAELKRVYTQLRMYKLKSIYQDNPHISKRKGGKKSSDKDSKILAKNRRLSIPPTSPATRRDLNRVEEDEKSSMMQADNQQQQLHGHSAASNSDLTVESSPHNVYLSRSSCAAVVTASSSSGGTNKLPPPPLESDQSVRV